MRRYGRGRRIVLEFRVRPDGPYVLAQGVGFAQTGEYVLAEGVGFEPTVPENRDSGFQDRRVQPLRHPSTAKILSARSV